MRSSSSFFAVLALLCLTIAPATPAETFQLEPYKDDLFRYPAPVAGDFGEDYVTVPFNHQRDVVARDEIPDEKTRPKYVSLDVKTSEADLLLRRDSEVVRYVGVGRTDGDAKVVVIFLHGLGASRLDGANDWRSGGNLNRIKNLMVRNDGVYLSADYAATRRKAKRQIAALIDAVAETSPEAPIFLICASIGARVCWDLAEDPTTAARLDGLLMIAAIGRPGFADSAVVRDPTRWIPIYMAHGNRDRNVSWRPQDRLFKEIKSVAPDYPIRFALFDTGTHRAPLRMTDWRLAINWMLEVKASRSP